MSMAATQKQSIITSFRQSDSDTGSPEVQVALLTEKINHLTGHMQSNRHDFHSRRGLLLAVGRRNRLLKYLARKDRQRYLELIQKLGLRK